jgi:hypothetical protein
MLPTPGSTCLQSCEPSSHQLRSLLSLHQPKGAHRRCVSPGNRSDQTRQLISICAITMSTSSSNLCWWNSTDDPSAMIYEDLEESLRFIDAMCRERGAFQGGLLAGIATVCTRPSLSADLNLLFSIMSSGSERKEFFVEYLYLLRGWCAGLRPPTICGGYKMACYWRPAPVLSRLPYTTTKIITSCN